MRSYCNQLSTVSPPCNPSSAWRSYCNQLLDLTVPVHPTDCATAAVQVALAAQRTKGCAQGNVGAYRTSTQQQVITPDCGA
jgi:hypothetical protein